ncbi:uncharacterized protein LOC110706604 [Chenopodium quinoa]|uniref:uncharacterized protein LOC110706604 n=1 Tax=Chenopodium quinoa TaxID=63459 RepID=UPI000B770FC4|nr:uncharacterized protein LOC110706604 [Chenopodium quinoa]
MASDFDLNDDMDEDAAANDAEMQEMFEYDLNFAYDDEIDSKNTHDNIGLGLNQTPSPGNNSNQMETAGNNNNQQASVDQQDTTSNNNNNKHRSTQKMLKFTINQQGGGLVVGPSFHNCGRKRISIPNDAIRAVAMGNRSCQRDLAAMLNVGKSTIHRLIKRGEVRPHTNALKPKLTPANRLDMIRFILNSIIGDSPGSKRVYQPMYKTVHIDKKWFTLSKKTHRLYLEKGERGLHRVMQLAKFIPKFMFQGAVAKPCYNAQKEVILDGKIGIFPFAKKELALRCSKYKKKGEMVTKVIDPINKDVSRWMLIEKQDNAKAHITQDDAVWQEHCEQPRFTFILTHQPPNNPDVNVLDLGFFRSIQSLQHKKMAKTPDQLIKAVEDAFNELPSTRLFKVWVTLCHTMNQILKSKGSNRFEPPHVNKDKLEREGRLQDPI